MDLGLLISALAAIITTTKCSCFSTTLFARASSSSRSVYSTRYANCYFYIRPYLFYANSYYLEISWSSSKFDVKGNMPSCKESYVEIFLTRNYESIGKFCSSNAGSPFKMYSKDGYAQISYYKSPSNSSGGFTFNYQLKSKTSDLLGDTQSTSCSDSVNYGNSGVLYSNGWPSGYLQSLSTCQYKIQKSNNHQGVYVVFMDINLNPFGFFSDCVQFFGSNVSNHYPAISSKLCGSEEIMTYTTYNRYLRIDFIRWSGGGSSYRGFVAGYVMFGSQAATTSTPTTSWNKPHDAISSSNSLAIALSVSIPLIFIIVTVTGGFIVFCTKCRRRQDTTGERVYQNLTYPSALTIQQTTLSQNTTPQSFQAIPGMRNPTFLRGQSKGPSQSTTENDGPGSALPQYSSVVRPTTSSFPTEGLQSSHAQGIQGQQRPPRPPTFGNPASSEIRPEDVPPNYPPPSYSTVFNT